MRERNRYWLALLVLLSGCLYGPPQFHTYKVEYDPCGRKICVHASRSRPSMNPAIGFSFGADPHVYTEVLVPLKQLRTRDFRLLADGWATDGKKVWCGRPDPEGTIENLRNVGDHYYSIGTTFWFGCERMTDAHLVPRVIHSFELLGCGIGRIDGELVHLDRDQLQSLAWAVDVQSFAIDDRVACRAHDSLRQYRITDGVPRPLAAH